MSNQGKFQAKKSAAAGTSSGGKSTKAAFFSGCLTAIAAEFIILVLLIAVVWTNKQAIYNWAVNIAVERFGSKATQAQYDGGTEISEDELAALVGIEESTQPSTEETEPTEETTVDETEPDWGETGKVVNILVVGQDSRDGEESRLADSVVLFTLNKETSKLTLTSFLRDSYVDLPDYKTHTCGWNRLNTAYALGYVWDGAAGAMDMLNTTLKNNFGATVDGDVEIGFDTFTDLVDKLGGITVELYGDELTYMQETADAYWWGCTYVEGENWLGGVGALEYARMRHANNADSDMNRTERQRTVIVKLIEKLRALSLTELNDLIDDVLSSIVTNISTDEMKAYVSELLPYLFTIEIEGNQCPYEGSYWGEYKELPDGTAGVLVSDYAANQKRMAAICAGEDPE